MRQETRLCWRNTTCSDRKKQVDILSRIIFIFLFSVLCTSGRAQTSNTDRFYAEDVLEYVPTAAIFALKACGVRSKSTFTQQLLVTGAAFAVNVGAVELLKHTVHSERPDHSDDHGFPSGHAAISFLGADMLFCEYKDVSPWIGIGGYAVAATTGILRVHHDRHHWLDVAGGAAIGIGCSRLSQWLTPKIFRFKKKDAPQVSSAPCLYDDGLGLMVNVNF